MSEIITEVPAFNKPEATESAIEKQRFTTLLQAGSESEITLQMGDLKPARGEYTVNDVPIAEITVADGRYTIFKSNEQDGIYYVAPVIETQQQDGTINLTPTVGIAFKESESFVFGRESWSGMGSVNGLKDTLSRKQLEVTIDKDEVKLKQLGNTNPTSVSGLLNIETGNVNQESNKHYVQEEARRIGESALYGSVEGAQSPEQREKERLIRIFSPYETPKHLQDDTPKESGYDWLLSDDYDREEQKNRFARQNRINEEKSRNPRLNITQEKDQFAVEKISEIRRIEPQLGRLIDEVTKDLSTDQERVEAIRNDPDVRIRISAYLMDKLNLNINKGWLVGDRILDNDQKNPNTYGYSELGYLRSREYAVLLALSKIDGTFDYKKEEGDRLQFGPNGEVQLGQHRHAADLLLSDAGAEKPDINKYLS